MNERLSRLCTDARDRIKGGQPAGLAIHIACNGNVADKEIIAKELGRHGAKARSAHHRNEEKFLRMQAGRVDIYG